MVMVDYLLLNQLNDQKMTHALGRNNLIKGENYGEYTDIDQKNAGNFRGL